MSSPPHLLILGGGFVARKAVQKLRRRIKRGDRRVTVVDRDNYLAIHALIAEMVTGRIMPSTILNPNRRVFEPAQLHVGEIEEIDTDAKRVVVSRRSDGDLMELEYDYALVCVGSGENLEAYPGLAEHAFRLKLFDDCFRLKNHGRSTKGVFIHETIGFNFSFTDLQAAVGLAQLNKLPEIIRRKQRFLDTYQAAVSRARSSPESSRTSSTSLRRVSSAASSGRSAASSSCTRGRRSCPSSTARRTRSAR